jgi:hypothetical protein
MGKYKLEFNWKRGRADWNNICVNTTRHQNILIPYIDIKGQEISLVKISYTNKTKCLFLNF